MPLREITNRQGPVTRSRTRKVMLREPGPVKGKAVKSPVKRASTKRRDYSNIRAGKRMVDAFYCNNIQVAPSLNISRYPKLGGMSANKEMKQLSADAAVRESEVVADNVPEPPLGPRCTSRLYNVVTETRDDGKSEELREGKSIDPNEKTSCGRVPPPGVRDYDKEELWNPTSVSVYAMDIFNYLKSRESKFIVKDYISQQTEITKSTRAILVDYMVCVQLHLMLNHEVLYLAVKLMDLYLSKAIVNKDRLQLLGSTTMFIACKYEDQRHPSIMDFVYLCDCMYDKQEFLRLERSIMDAIGWQLGVPISYRFLRRYARCTRMDLQLLTLARYILEYSLMNYDIIRHSDSMLAAAALYLALKMKGESWTPTLEYYTGYKVEDIKDIVWQLNDGLHKKPMRIIKTIREKYFDRAYFCVARIPLVKNRRIEY